MTGTSDGCEVDIPEWCARRGGVYRITHRVHEAREGAQGAQIEEGVVGVKASPESMKHEDWQLFQGKWLQTVSFEAVIYVKEHKDELMIVALYVNDMIFMGNNQRLIDEFKREMKLEFEMMRYFLGLEIK
jgi:Reverse transcriptase (RNA-dependent DNA polymerase)